MTPGVGGAKCVLRMRKFCLAFLLCNFVLALPGLGARAGAFLQKDGEGIVISTSRFTGSSNAFDAKGRIVPVDLYSKYELSTYIEYGAADWITLILQPTLGRNLKEGPPFGVYYGPGSVEAGARVKIGEYETAVFSTQATIHIPGSRNVANPALIGNTGYEFDARLLAAMPFEIAGFTGFADAQLGYRMRGGGPPNEFRADFTLGFRPAAKLLLLAQSFNILAPANGSPGFPHMRQHKLQASAVWNFRANYSLQSGVFTTVSGRNARPESGYFSAVWYKF